MITKYLTLLTISLLLTPAVNTVPNDVMGDFLVVYKDVVELGRLGIDVSGLVSKLSVALDLISDGSPDSLSKAESLINDVRSEVYRLKSEANYYVMYRSLYKYSIIAVLVLIPLAIYYLLPRIYLIIWFRLRRRWVVKYGRT